MTPSVSRQLSTKNVTPQHPAANQYEYMAHLTWEKRHMLRSFINKKWLHNIHRMHSNQALHPTFPLQPTTATMRQPTETGDTTLYATTMTDGKMKEELKNPEFMLLLEKYYYVSGIKFITLIDHYSQIEGAQNPSLNYSKGRYFLKHSKKKKRDGFHYIYRLSK